MLPFFRVGKIKARQDYFYLRLCLKLCGLSLSLLTLNTYQKSGVQLSNTEYPLNLKGANLKCGTIHFCLNFELSFIFKKAGAWCRIYTSWNPFIFLLFPLSLLFSYFH